MRRVLRVYRMGRRSASGVFAGRAGLGGAAAAGRLAAAARGL